MPRFAANLSMLYAEHPFLDRIAAAAQDGFAAVEWQFADEHSTTELRARLSDAGLPLVLMNAPPGDWAGGERGLACLPDREGDFRRSIDRALADAAALGCPRVHVLAGCMPAGVDRSALLECYVRRLDWAARQTAGSGVTLMIEPINGRDIPGYLLQHQAEAHAIVQQLGVPHVQVQLDLYHCQIMDGDLATHLRDGLASGRVGHLQIAGVPGRHEPDADGELNWPWLLPLVDQLGYAGWVGCEYRPRAGTSAGLGWREAVRSSGTRGA